MRRFQCLLVFLLPVILLQAQDPKDTISTHRGIFPLTLVLEAALYAADGCRAWQPDWSLDLPPDAFKVQTGDLARCTIESEEISLHYGFDSQGRIVDFPFLLNGMMIQVRLRYNYFSEFREMTLFMQDQSNHFEILDTDGIYPLLVRAFVNNLWYFIYFNWGINEIMETWYDEEGSFAGAYGSSLTKIGNDPKIRSIWNYTGRGIEREFFYDSRGFKTEISGPGGIYKVQYFREDSPRYWRRQSFEPEANGEVGEGNFALQYDEQGFLIRITSLDEDIANVTVNCFYEYTLDDRGNWIERREIRMINHAGLLIPAPGFKFRRILEYDE